MIETEAKWTRQKKRRKRDSVSETVVHWKNRRRKGKMRKNRKAKKKQKRRKRH